MANVDDSRAKQRFGEWLRQTRLGKRESLEHVSAIIGVDPSAFSRWERGKSLPSVAFLQKLCAWGEISEADIIALTAAEK